MRAMANPVLRHRMILNFEGQAEEVSTDSVIDQLIQEVPETMATPVAVPA